MPEGVNSHGTHREKLLGYSKHTEAAVQPRVACREDAKKKKQRLELITGARHVGVVAYLVSWFLLGQKVEAKEPSMELVTVTVEPEEAAPGGVATSDEHTGTLLPRVGKKTHRGREVRRHGPMDHLGRQSLAETVLELHAALAAVQWRMRSQTDVHSRGIHGTRFVAL